MQLKELQEAVEKNARALEKHTEVDAQAIKDQHEKNEQFVIHLNEIQKTVDLNHKEMKEILFPIAETYGSVSRMAKWGMSFLVLVSIMVGIIVGIKNIIK